MPHHLENCVFVNSINKHLTKDTCREEKCFKVNGKDEEGLEPK
jgi:hypothetical protein